MDIANKKRSLVIFLGAVIYGAAAFTGPASAQNAAAAVAATQGTDSMTDEELSKRVKAALHADPYFYDRHVKVSVENGAVVLHGMVFSDWDIRNAIRIARQAADQRLVVDDLTIEQGGR